MNQYVSYYVGRIGSYEMVSVVHTFHIITFQSRLSTNNAIKFINIAVKILGTPIIESYETKVDLWERND